MESCSPSGARRWGKDARRALHCLFQRQLSLAVLDVAFVSRSVVLNCAWPPRPPAQGVFSLTLILAVSKLRRPFLSKRHFFITVRLTTGESRYGMRPAPQRAQHRQQSPSRAPTT
jgi:hypothetical protein